MDLLRTYGARGTTTANLLAAGQLFGFSQNQLRVNLSRLVGRGLVEQLSRGQYRIAPNSAPVNTLADSWRDGESRLRDWNGTSFNIVSCPQSDSRSVWSLETLGFIEVHDGFWTRPDNLSIDIVSTLFSLGLTEHAWVAIHGELSEQHVRYVQSRYQVNEFNQRYQDLYERLDQSLQLLPQLAIEDAMRESFMLGGEAIQLLAKDPLLPPAWMPVEPRTRVREIMSRYDTMGKRIWAKRNHESPDSMPTALANHA